MSSNEAASQTENQVIVYCDEAGNTGPNYVDPNQPFYVLASWAVPYTRIPEAAAVVEDVRKKFTPQAPELSASTLLKKKDGVRGAVSLIESFGSLGCIPFYVVAEKRYCIAGKIVETFLDPLTNSRVTNSFIPDSTTKQEIANTLYEQMTDAELNSFAIAYRDPKTLAFDTAFETVVSAVRSRVNPELAELFEGARSELQEIAELEAGTVFGKFFDTLNHPVLASMFMMIEIAARSDSFQPLKFVHDKSHAYEDGFKKLFGLLKWARRGAFKYPSGALALYPLQCIREFETADSQTNPMIQAADILAGSIRHCSMNAISGESPSENDNRLAMLTLPFLLRNEQPRIAWPVASNQWYGALGKKYFEPFLVAEPQEDASPRRSVDRPQQLEPAAIFPVTRQNSTSLGKDTERRFLVPFPVYALIGKQTGALFCVEGIDRLADRGGTAVILFPDKEDAESCLNNLESEALAESFELCCFDVQQIPQMLDALRDSLEITQNLCYSSKGELLECTDLEFHISMTERSLDRAIRAVGAGAAKQIYKEHVVGEYKIRTMLADNGEYAAIIDPKGPISYGETRELAIEAVLNSVSADKVKSQQCNARSGLPLDGH